MQQHGDNQNMPLNLNYGSMAGGPGGDLNWATADPDSYRRWVMLLLSLSMMGMQSMESFVMNVEFKNDREREYVIREISSARAMYMNAPHGWRMDKVRALEDSIDAVNDYLDDGTIPARDDKASLRWQATRNQLRTSIERLDSEEERRAAALKLGRDLSAELDALHAEIEESKRAGRFQDFTILRDAFKQAEDNDFSSIPSVEVIIANSPTPLRRAFVRCLSLMRGAWMRQAQAIIARRIDYPEGTPAQHALDYGNQPMQQTQGNGWRD